jgi:PAS domain S-box-containing protein
VDSEPIRVLLVDDDQGDFEMTRAMLSKAEHVAFNLDWVSTFEEALDAFQAGDHQVYLLDYFLEDRTGLDLLKEASKQGLDAPVIMLTGRGSRQVDLEAMEAGAADYLVKGRFDPEGLERAIRYSIERHRAAQALRESEERHRSMFDHLPVGLYRSDPDGTSLEVNPALVRILGYPDRESLQRLYSSELYVHADDRPRFWGLLERFGVVRGFESSIRRLDGVTIRVRNTARLHRDLEGTVLYLEGTLEDISEERAAEELRGSEARFRAVFEGSGTGIALVDLDGIILEANPSFADIFNATAKEMEGVPYADQLVKDEQAAVIRELEGLARGERSHLGAERRFRTRDGGEVWARASLTLVRNQESEADHLVVLLDHVSNAEGKE